MENLYARRANVSLSDTRRNIQTADCTVMSVSVDEMMIGLVARPEVGGQCDKMDTGCFGSSEWRYDELEARASNPRN